MGCETQEKFFFLSKYIAQGCVCEFYFDAKLLRQRDDELGFLITATYEIQEKQKV